MPLFMNALTLTFLIITVVFSNRINKAWELHPCLDISDKTVSPLSFSQRNLTAHRLPVSAKDILKECNIISADSLTKRFSRNVAAVFPNNKENSDLVVSYHSKLSLLFPRLFSVSYGYQNGVRLHKLNDDEVVADDVSQINNGIFGSYSVVPVVDFQAFSVMDLFDFFHSSSQVNSFAVQLLSIIRENNFEGICLDFATLVFENQLDPTRNENWDKNVSTFIINLSEALHSQGYSLYLSLALPLANIHFDPTLLSPLLILAHATNKYVDGILFTSHRTLSKSLRATYYSGHRIDNALTKIEEFFIRTGRSDIRSSIFVGLSFMGNELINGKTQRFVDSKTVQTIMSKYKTKVGVDPISLDQWIDYNIGEEEHRIYYPTLQGLQERLTVIQAHKCNVFIDNPAAGHPYFMDLF